MSEELKPCPFCGGEAEAFYDDAGGVYEVQCQECGAEPYIGSRSGALGMRTLGDVIKAWNRRAERTCRAVLHRVEYQEGVVAHTCSECRGILVCFDFEQDPPKPIGYCPECGARVIEEGV